MESPERLKDRGFLIMMLKILNETEYSKAYPNVITRFGIFDQTRRCIRQFTFEQKVIFLRYENLMIMVKTFYETIKHKVILKKLVLITRETPIMRFIHVITAFDKDSA